MGLGVWHIPEVCIYIYIFRKAPALSWSPSSAPNNIQHTRRLLTLQKYIAQFETTYPAQTQQLPNYVSIGTPLIIDQMPVWLLDIIIYIITTI